MWNQLPHDVLEQGARKLGMFRNGKIAREHDNHPTILRDYCLHNVLSGGRSVVEQYLIDSSPDHDSVEYACLHSMQHSIYTLLLTESIEPDFGVKMRDLRTGESLFMIDINYSRTAVVNNVLATRLFLFDEFVMASGAALPLGLSSDKRMKAMGQTFSKLVERNQNTHEYFDPAPLITSCLKNGCADYIRYQSQTSESQVPRSGPGRVGRNEKCPCGSKRKYKRCCMRQA
jgi:uncharacterized protein YuzB (UPF0349 family)